jgi:hypothetical protein
VDEVWWYGGVWAELYVIVTFIDERVKSLSAMIMNIRGVELTHRLADSE